MVPLCQQVKQSVSHRLLQLEIVPLCLKRLNLKQMPNVTPKGNGYTQNEAFPRERLVCQATSYSPSKVSEVKMRLCRGVSRFKQNVLLAELGI